MLGTWPKPLTPLRWLCRPPPFPLDDPVSDVRRPCTRPRLRGFAHDHNAGPRRQVTAHGHRAGPQRRVTAHATCTATAHGHGAVTRTASERACVPFARHAKPLLKS